jgi:hypothetical protein
MSPENSHEPGDTKNSGESKWYQSLPLSEILLLLEIILGLKAGLGQEISEEAGNLAKSGLNLGRSLVDWALGLLRHPLLLWTCRLYFFLLPLLALIFLVLGFPTVAYALLIIQMALIILTTYTLSVFVRHGKGHGFFYRLLIFCSSLEFLLISFLNFFVILPGGLFSGLQYVTLIGLLVALIPLSVLIQTRWTYGWVIIFVISSAPLIAYLFFPDGAMRAWVGERSAWQDYTRVVITESLPVYDRHGRSASTLQPPGDTLYADFSHKIKIYDRLYAFRCYPNFVGGEPIYLPLIRGSNYYHLIPQAAVDGSDKSTQVTVRAEVKSEAAESSSDSLRAQPHETHP